MSIREKKTIIAFLPVTLLVQLFIVILSVTYYGETPKISVCYFIGASLVLWFLALVDPLRIERGDG